MLAGACSAGQQIGATALTPKNQSTKIFAADGTLITTLKQEENREIIPIDRIPDHLRKAVVAIEDARFFSHKGFDAKAILRALYRNANEGTVTEGGSTITQQLVRNSIKEVGTEQTLERKIREASFAYRVESTLSKDKILELYLNTVYFGEGAYGVQTASKTYFAKDVEDLTIEESALLAGLIKAPVLYDPYADPDSAKARRDHVLDRMFLLRFAGEKEIATAKGTPVDVQEKKDDIRYPAPFFIDYVTRLIQHSDQFPDLGESVADRANTLFRGGLRIHTTLDLKMQEAAEDAIRRTLNQRDDPAASLVAIDPKDGHIKAIVGGRDFFAEKTDDHCFVIGALNNDGTPKTCAKVNLALGADGGGSGRQTGSSFKALVLAAALDAGIPLSRTYRGSSCMSIPNADAGGTKPWRVCNYGGAGFGTLDLTQATALSVNTVFAQLIMDVGPERVIGTARKMGVRSPMVAVPSATLGVNALSPLDMATAFTVFPNQGIYREPIAITKITDAFGNELWKPDQDVRRAISEPAAFLATSAMEATFRYGTARNNRIGRPAFAKTGTSQDWWDAWFVGGAGTDLVAAVAVFWPDFEISMVPNCSGQRTEYAIGDGEAIPPTCRETRLRVTGGTFPGQIWQQFMLNALEGIPASELPEVEAALINVRIDASRGCLPNPYTPEDLIEVRTFIRGTEPLEVCTEPEGPEVGNVPNTVGFPEAEAVKILEDAGFKVDKAEEFSQLYPPGRVVRQSPDVGEEAELGSTVTIWLSTGGVKVPDLNNMTVSDAIDALEANGLEAVVDATPECKGNNPPDSCRVWDQDPNAGTQVASGSKVTIFVQEIDPPEPSPSP